MSAFDWGTPLGVSVALFLGAAAFQLFIGVATTGYLLTGPEGGALFFTERTDRAAFGKSPAEILDAQPGVAVYRQLVWLALAAFLGALGILEGGLAWFGLRQGASWARATLAACALLLGVYYAAIVGLYVAKGARLGLGEVPPFMWVPTALRIPALVLAWIPR